MPASRPAVAMAIKAGFPGIDAANHYHNQVGVALGIKDAGVARDKLWIETKVEPCGQ